MCDARIAHAVFCAILFAGAAVLLGLTAYHVHVTETMFIGPGFYVPIVVELLVTSCLAIIVSLGSFIAIILRRGSKNILGLELFLLIIIWIMFLVGASVFSRNWHNVSWCFGYQHVCRTLNAIIAFSWINLGLTTSLMIACGVDMESTKSSHTDTARGGPVQTSQTTPVTNTTDV